MASSLSMKEGREFVEEADKRIYEREVSRSVKSKFFTGLAIFSGLISKEITLNLIKKRRAILIGSYAYGIMKAQKRNFLRGKKRN